ncbi:MAG: MvaI/BcnI family restriction endonuclease [Bacteroidales bacterium]
MIIEEFKTKFREIKGKGFIPTTRRKATGIGHTLETHLGIVEKYPPQQHHLRGYQIFMVLYKSEWVSQIGVIYMLTYLVFKQAAVK